MIQGELPEKNIFEVVKGGVKLLKNINKEETSFLEILMVLRILYELGYIVKDKLTQDFISDVYNWDREVIKKVMENKHNLVEIINKALRESQL